VRATGQRYITNDAFAQLAHTTHPAMLARVFLLALTTLGSLVRGVSADTDGQTDNGDDFYLDWHPQYGTSVTSTPQHSRSRSQGPV
jgi:hypothetical protein